VRESGIVWDCDGHDETHYLWLVTKILGVLSIFTALVLCASVETQFAQSSADPNLRVGVVSSNAVVLWNASVTGATDVEHSADLSRWVKLSISNSAGVFQHPIETAAVGFYRLRWKPPLANVMIRVLGGTFHEAFPRSTQIATFHISKYEVTWREWQEVREWSISNGYSDLANVGMGSAGDHPVREVGWSDAAKWSNARSEKEGLRPVYRVAGAVYRSGENIPDVDSSANGYRLPSLNEWMWASRGGENSKGYYFSGGDELSIVAWHWYNSDGAVVDLWWGRGTWVVDAKEPNELGIHDMSGNVFEWVGTAKGTGSNYSDHRYYLMGGSWYTSYESAFYHTFLGNDGPPDYRSDTVGFRVARNE
jgi:sulfatase modifying factor 1